MQMSPLGIVFAELDSAACQIFFVKNWKEGAAK